MDVKRYFRAPVMWILLAVLAVVVLMQVVSSSAGYKTEDTSTVVAAINDGKAQSVQVTTGDSSMIKVQLKSGQQIDGTSQIQAPYTSDQFAATLQSDMQTDVKNGTPASPATARASRVLPVPGGP